MGLHWPPAQLTDLVSFIVGIPPDGGGRKPKRGAATDREADPKFRDVIEEDGEDSVSEGTGTVGSTESAFLWARDTPAEEVESALGWRMNVLEGRMNGVSVEDEDMADAEGEPASEVEVVEN